MFTISKTTNRSLVVLLAALIFSAAIVADAQTTAFTYQGRLSDNNQAANGQYDFRFQLYNAQINFPTGSPVTVDNVSVVNGSFTVSLDFSSSVEFRQTANSKLSLEIAVRPAGSGNPYTPLAPRQPLNAAPFAISSLVAETAFYAPYAGVANFASTCQTANSLSSGGAANFVQTNDFRLTNDRNPTAGSGFYIQNSSVQQTNANFNISGSGVIGGNFSVQGTISGNGSGLTNLNAANITNGTLNNAQIPNLDAGKITSGTFADALIPNLNASKITAGTFGDDRLPTNLARLNVANNFTANQTVGGALTANSFSVPNNAAITDAQTTFNGVNGFVAFGTSGSGTIPATGAGSRMMWYGRKSAFRVGRAEGAGGADWDDENVGEYSVGMGFRAKAKGDNSIALGFITSASGFSSTAIGYLVGASGNNSTAIGNYASTQNKEGSFVYGDNSIASTVTAETANEFVVRAAGGFRFRTSADLSTGCNLPAGSGVFQCTSSKSLKENFVALDGTDVLSRLRRLPVMQWNYIGEGGNVRHIGTFAEDFFREFGLGTDAKSIGLLDIAGVNTAAIQALDIKVEQQQQTIERQQAAIDELRQIVCALKPNAAICRQEEK